MKTVTAQNVDEALPILIDYLDTEGKVENSRNGPVIAAHYPVCVTYCLPRQRFVMHPIRRNNVAFLVMEGLWMLSGREDVNWLARFNEQMRAYSDNGYSFHGAYGHRLRSGRIDQLTECAAILKKDPTSRRAVAQIWNWERDLCSSSKDIPCNDLIMFRVVWDSYLDMTVCNRSNDLIWGMCGANAAHFSMIQEYVAAKAGYLVGRYVQFSNNLHMYTNTPRLDELRKIPVSSGWYDGRNAKLVPLVLDISTFDKELGVFMAATERNRILTFNFKEPFLETVAKPLFNYWISRKYLKATPENYQRYIASIEDQAVRHLAAQWVSEEPNNG